MQSKRRRVSRLVEKYVLNPHMRFALRRGFAPANFALLETTGRRSKLPRHTPVGGHVEGDVFWFVAEHGRQCDYVQNLIEEPRVRVKAAGRWYAGRATLLPDDDGRQRRRDLDRRHGKIGRFDGAIFRATATKPLTIRVDLGPAHRD